MAEEERSGWFGTTLSKLKSALSRTKGQLVDSVINDEDEDSSAAEQHGGMPAATATGGSPSANTATVAARAPKPPRPIDDDYLEDLEEKLIRADIGMPTAEKMVSDLRKDARAKGWNSGKSPIFLKQEFTTMLELALIPA